jgi:hypothetical protein
MSINIASLPIVPSTDVRDTTVFVVDTTDSNGQRYTGQLPSSTLFGGGNGCACVQAATLTLTSAQILALNSTPIEFGITPASGKYIRMISADATMDYQGTPYASNGKLQIRTVGATAYQASWTANGMLFGTVTRKVAGTLSSVTGATDTQLITDADLEAYVDSGNPTAGDSPVTITILYVELD